MTNPSITGLGVVSAIGQGKERSSIASSAANTRSAASSGPAAGRARPSVGAEIDPLQVPGRGSASSRGGGSGLVVGGSIVQPRELVATALQMKRGVLHPCRNLEDPIDPRFDWVRAARPASIRTALSVSLGFGGLSTATFLTRDPR